MIMAIKAKGMMGYGKFKVGYVDSSFFFFFVVNDTPSTTEDYLPCARKIFTQNS